MNSGSVSLLRRLVTLRSRVLTVGHDLCIPSWTGPDLKIAVIADLHVAAPWTTLGDVTQLVGLVNDWGPDLTLLAGDYIAGRGLPGLAAPAHDIVARLGPLTATQGVFAILGNHDWWDCQIARDSQFAHCEMIDALNASPITLLRNRAVELGDGAGRTYWLAGLDSQRPIKSNWRIGYHRPNEAFAGIPAGAPTILAAHEPDYFAEGDTRAQLQISGHTHGGQMNLVGWRPLTPSYFGGRYAYGHKIEKGRHLVVSGGVGFSGLPMRIGQPPEITFVTLTGAPKRDVSGGDRAESG